MRILRSSWLRSPHHARNCSRYWFIEGDSSRGRELDADLHAVGAGVGALLFEVRRGMLAEPAAQRFQRLQVFSGEVEIERAFAELKVLQREPRHFRQRRGD